MDKFDEAYAKFNGGDKYDAAFQRFAAPQKSEGYQRGREANSSRQGLMAAVNGPLFGFGDEILGAIQAPFAAMVTGNSIADEYRHARDTFRGMQDQRKAEAPVTTALTQAAVSAPMLVLNPFGEVAGAAKAMLPGFAAKAAPAVTGLASKAAQAAASGFGYGAIQGVGDSEAEDFGGMAQDGFKSGAVGAGVGAVAAPVASVLGAGVKNVAQRVSGTAAADYARQKIAEALSRDARGTVFQSGQANPVAQASARLEKLGPEATVADAAGQNTKQLLDTLATLPGRTKDAAEQMIHSRQAGRAGRLIEAAQDGLSPQSQRLNPQINQWVTARQQAAAPLYDQLRKTTVTPSSNLASLVSTADDLGAVSLGREMALARRQPFTLDAKNPAIWSMNDLDHVKQGLDQKIAKQWDAVEGRLTPLGTAYQDLKNALVGELDRVTLDPRSGQSLYKSARDAFAGPSALIDAAQAGRQALTKDGASIASMTSGMSSSELDAFRIGTFEALRNKLGKEAGQTEILKMWKEPATQDRLREVFGNEINFRSFAAKVAREARLKGLESVGRGSQTAARQFGAGDLDTGVWSDAGSALTAAKTGNVMGALGAAKDAWNRISTPQTVRDQMGQILLSKGTVAQNSLTSMSDLIQRINERNATMAQGIGLLSGSQIGSRLATPIQVPGLLSQ